MNRFEIKKPQVSYYEHNAREKGMFIVEELLAGKNYAVVTDAGMPCISDPGEDIVRMCAENGVEVVAVPGPSALISAIALSALPTGRFCFEGFLSTSNKSRREHLESLKTERRTMIFYEAPHKLLRTLEDMKNTFGEDRKISLCRELTKLHEQTVRTTLGGAIEYFTQTPPKGEFVLVIDGAPEEENEFTIDDALELVDRYRAEGLGHKAACKKAAADTGFSANELYSSSIK